MLDGSAPIASSARVVSNAMTIDVEDYFQVAALAPRIDRSSWDSIERRVEPNVDRLLQMLRAQGVRATFFTLGWIAERHPALVRRIVAEGHELASHGYGHQRASEQTPAGFREDVVRARAILEDIGGVRVAGYRAPSFSIGASNLWAFDELAAAGYRYSSSVYPVRHDHYGMPDAPRFPFAARAGVVEIPVSTLRLWGRNWPAGGGGFFRLLPYSVSRGAISRVNRVDGKSAIFYCHPWEFDPDQPRVAGLSARSRFRHYLNLDRTEARLRALLTDFRWDRVDRVFARDLDWPAAAGGADS
jgi:polysaccharide deacetylase family protein (PEP-CTERM system associated)